MGIVRRISRKLMDVRFYILIMTVALLPDIAHCHYVLLVYSLLFAQLRRFGHPGGAGTK